MAIPEDDPCWDVAIADPGPTGLFADPVYDRGGRDPAGAAHEHRRRRVLRRRTALARPVRRRRRHDGGLPGLYQEASGKKLTRFFRVWVDEPGKPVSW